MPRPLEPLVRVGEHRVGKHGAAVLSVLVALYVGLRLLALHASFDDLCLPNFELALMGNLAKAIEGGWSGPPLYQYYDNCGGHLVTGLLGAGAFALFGDSYWALKLVPLAFGGATLVLLWVGVGRWYSRRAAPWAALLFALPVPTLAKYSMLAKGNHFEGLFFQLLALFAFLRMHERGVARGAALCGGLAAGIATFAYFGSAALLAGMALAHLLARGPTGTARDLAWIGPGFALGCAPLVAILLVRGPGGSHFLQRKLASVLDRSPDEAFERLRAFATEVLPRAAGFQALGPVPGRVLDALFLAVFAAAWLLLAARLARAWRGRPRPDDGARVATLRFVPLLAHLPIVAATVAMSSFEFAAYAPPLQVGRFRYLVPHFALASVVIAVAWAGLPRRGRRGLGTVLGLLLAVTASAWAGLVDWRFGHAGSGLRYDGYLFRHFPVAMGRPARSLDGRLEWDRERIAAQLARLPAEHRHQAYASVGYWVAWSLDRTSRGSAPIDVLLDDALTRFPAEHHLDLARGTGSYLRSPPGGLETALDERFRGLAASHPLAPYVAEGLCLDPELTLSRLLGTRERRSLEVGAAVPPALRGAWARGRGLACGRVLRRGIRADVAAITATAADLPIEERADFWFGVGSAWGERGDPTAALVGLAPPEHREHALLGFGAEARHVFGPEAAPDVVALSGTDVEIAQRGLAWPAYPLPYRL